MTKKRIILLLFLLSSCVLTGCWDRTELEQRGFVIGVAVDEGKQDVDEKKAHGKQTLKITFQVVVPSMLKAGEQLGGSNESSKAYFNISIEGKTMLAVIARMTAMTSRTPFFEHLKLIVISEKVARTEYSFANVLDYYLRNNDARRNVAVMISKGEARQVLETIPKGETTPVIYVYSIAQNQDSIRTIPDTRIGEIHEYLLKNKSFMIQRVKADRDSVSLIGSSVMKGTTNKLIGFLDERETQGLNFLRPGIEEGTIEVQVGDSFISYNVDHIHRKIKADLSDPANMKFVFHLTAEGSMLEAFERLDYLSDKTLQELQEKTNKELDSIVQATVHKLQHEYKADVIGLGTYLREHHPKVWKQVRENWDTGANLFSKVDIQIVSKAEIRRIGSINNSEKRGVE